MSGAGILEDLDQRGLVHDETDRAALAARLDEGPITLYSGFDPTADSLHVGHLVPLLLLRRFQDAGNQAIALAGGATGMIGDPGGRSEERNLLDDATLDTNFEAIRSQLGQFVDLSPGRGTLVDNRTWTQPLGVLDFLRDVGKHVTVGSMVAKESVKARLASEHGISFTEFSYMLLQANDYFVLHTEHGCELQVGGADQWGNITAGIDLIRRRAGVHVHGVTVPLVTRSDGVKFGKSQTDDVVWLSPARTSPYAFYQYWINVGDDDVRRFLLQLTLVDVAEADAVAAAHAEAPETRVGQRRLAEEVTTLVHGAAATRAAQAATTILFGGDPAEADDAALFMVADEVGSFSINRQALATGLAVEDLVVASGLATSRSDVRRGLTAGELWLNGERLVEGARIGATDLLRDRFALLRRGRKRHAVGLVGDRA